MGNICRMCVRRACVNKILSLEIDAYTLLHIKQITNVNLLHSIGSSVLCGDSMGWKSEKRADACLCLTDSCMPMFN